MKRTPGYTDEERYAYWAQIINDARRHPQGVTAYLKSQGLEKNNYYHWFKKNVCRAKPKHSRSLDLCVADKLTFDALACQLRCTALAPFNKGAAQIYSKNKTRY